MNTEWLSLRSPLIGLTCLTICAFIGCPSQPRVNPKPRTSTQVDTQRLDEAVAKADTNQDAIKKDAESLSKTLPEDARPPRIIGHAVDTKVQLALAKQTIDDLKAKDASNSEAADANAETIATLEASNAELTEQLNSSSDWVYGLMILIGAIGIPVSIAVMLKLDKQLGAFGLIIAVGSVVTGYFLREFACWIPLIGAGCAVWGGVMFWRQHSKDQDAHKQNDETVRELVATTADIQKHGWTQETRERLASSVSEPTRDRVRETKKTHKIADVALPAIPLATEPPPV